jgi:hypothetical protein
MTGFEKVLHTLDEYWIFKFSHKIFIKCKYKLRFMRFRAILMFLLFGMIYFYVSNQVLNDTEIINAFLIQFGLSLGDMNDYQTSHAASLFDNFIFYITVGIGLAFYSLIRPEDSSFDKKINYLFPRAAATIGGKKYLKKQINKLAIIAARTRVTVQLDEHCFDYDLTKSTMIYESKLSNLHNQESFTDGGVKLGFKISDDTKQALKDKYGEKRTEWGTIAKIRTMTSDDLDTWRWHTRGKHMLVSEKNEEIFELKELNIPPSGEAQLDFIGSTVSKNDGEVFDTFGVARFTELLEFYIVNNTEYSAKVEIYKIPSSEYSSDSKYDLATLNVISSHTRELKPSDHLQNSFSNSNHRTREFFSDFSLDDLLIWRVKFENNIDLQSNTE